jgi:hypothetical protein
LSDMYMVDLICDKELQAFYAQFGMKTACGMSIRKHKKNKEEKRKTVK